MRVVDELVLKLPPARVAELVDAGIAKPNMVGGRAMKEWANLAVSAEKQWAGLAEESLAYVRDKR
jgi:hypothetical protein